MSGCPRGNRWASRTGTRGNQIITSKPGLVGREFAMFDGDFAGTREERESTVWSCGTGTGRWGINEIIQPIISFAPLYRDVLNINLFLFENNILV